MPWSSAATTSAPRPVMPIHLVRHGEVDNPKRVVYADLPGFGLSERGEAEAEAAAQHLAELGVDHIYASPLQRAQETAATIAQATGAYVENHADLGEWHLGRRWAGVAWADLPTRFPGELEAYLATPTELDFSPESTAELAQRVAGIVREAATAHPGGSVVVVSHQDPIQAGRLALLDQPLTMLQSNKPGHCDVITLEPGTPWRQVNHWQPEVPGPHPPAWPPVAGN